MKALVIGATGATGMDLIDALVSDPGYSEVVAFTRRSTGIADDKLVEIMTDFDNLEAVSAQINGDVWFSCLGTTLKAAGSKEKQWHIDHDLPMAFATIAKRNGVSSVVLLSSHGASKASKVFYSRMKGQLEEDIIALDFDQCIIFRPGLLLRKDTDRPGERISATLLRLLNRIGMFRKFRPMPTQLLAEKLAKAPMTLPAGRHEIELDEIFRVW